MGQAVMYKYPWAEAEYKVIFRSPLTLPKGYAQELRRQIDMMADIGLDGTEKKFLKNCYYLSPAYIDFFEGYRYDPSEVKIVQDGNSFEVTAKGLWYRSIYWETQILPLMVELFNRMTLGDDYNKFIEAQTNYIIEQATAKGVGLRDMGALFAEFGTRRRFSYEVQKMVIKVLADAGGKYLGGTSNLHFAKMFGLTPIGTQAHEWYSYHAAQYGYRMANRKGLEVWTDVFDGALGIALPDTFTTDAFFPAFTGKFAKLFDGWRWDSGCPFTATDKFYSHYKNVCHVDPSTKSVIYSNAIDNLDMCRRLMECASGKFRASLAIGTWFTHDVGQKLTNPLWQSVCKPKNVVMKMVAAKPYKLPWTKTCKLSDDMGKYTGDPETIKQCLSAIPRLELRESTE
jgi:nicotinate phosphoribosyltransferase